MTMTVASLNHAPLPRTRSKIDALIVPAMMIVSMAFVSMSYVSTAERTRIVLKARRVLVISSALRMSVKNVPSMRIAQLDTAARGMIVSNVPLTSNVAVARA